MNDLAALHELLLAPGDLDLSAVAGLFTRSFDANGSIVFVIDPTGRDLYVGAADPPGSPAVENALRIPVGYGVAGLVAMNGHGVTLVDDSPRNASHRTLLRLEPGGTLSRMCVAGRGLGAAVVAVFSVHRHHSRPFDDRDLRRAQLFGDLVGLRLYAQGLLGAAAENRTQRDQLIAQAISAQEAERRRIAGDLHDGVTQALASLAFHLSAAEVGLDGVGGADPAVAEAVVQILKAHRLARLAYDETRAAITGLHSLILEDLGLVSALESLSKSVPQLDIEFRAESAARLGEIPDHCAAVLYRIAQEAINNAVKHAEAQRAVLSLRRVADTIVLGVTDDGVGFDVASVRGSSEESLQEHFGLTSIAERCALIGARLRIDSVQGRGTAVIVELPLRPPSSAGLTSAAGRPAASPPHPAGRLSR